MDRLHVGAGPIHLDGWLNFDIDRKHEHCEQHGDVLQTHFNENSFDVIYTCHMVEHLEINDAVECFNRFYKWLKPNGVLRLAVPSLEIATLAYSSGSDMKFLYGGDFKGYYLYDTPCERFNYFMKEWEHKITYDFKQLNLMLSNSGFRYIRRTVANETNIPDFSHDRFVSESLYVECIK